MCALQGVRPGKCPGRCPSLRSEQGTVSLALLCGYPLNAKGVTKVTPFAYRPKGRCCFLQAVVHVVVLGEIHGFCLYRDPLKGIIAEPPAGFLRLFYAFFHAKHLPVAQRHTMPAVGAGPVYFFSE